MTRPDTTKLGEMLKQRRLELGLSLRDLEEPVGVNFAHLSRIESGSKSPTPAVLRRLAKALKLNLADLQATAIQTLPTLAPYLRAKYELPEEAIAELEQHFADVSRQYQAKRPRRRS